MKRKMAPGTVRTGFFFQPAHSCSRAEMRSLQGILTFNSALKNNPVASHSARATRVNTLYLCFPGCAFLTYTARKAAVKAQNAMHEKITLPGVRKVNLVSTYEAIVFVTTWDTFNFSLSSFLSFCLLPYFLSAILSQLESL